VTLMVAAEKFVEAIWSQNVLMTDALRGAARAASAATRPSHT
jgi:hypothetical protein